VNLDAPKIWVDGVANVGIPGNDRGVLYGDGGFRTMLCCHGEVEALTAQLEKLRDDAVRIGLSPPTLELLQDDIAKALAPGQTGALRLSLSAGSSLRGYTRATVETRRILQISPLPAWPARHWRQGIQLQTIELPLATPNVAPGCKHLNRLEQVMAKRELLTQYQEGLMSDAHGAMACGIMSNVFWFSAGSWHTPSLQHVGVAGLTRQRLIQLMQREAISLNIVDVSTEQVREQAESLFMCNSLIGVWPVQAWDSQTYNWEQHAQANISGIAQRLGHPANLNQLYKDN